MKPFKDMVYHPVSEQLVHILRDRTQAEDSLFFRLLVGYYFCLVASQMRCFITTPDRGEVPVNMYTLNLAPSGYGKTQSMNFMEEEVLQLFRHRFIDETFPLLAEKNLLKLANKRANRRGTDPDDEIKSLNREFAGTGPALFSFDSGTAPAVKQLRHKLLLANAGSMNLIMDEVGDNLTENREMFPVFIELYDKGLAKNKLIKNTSDNNRNEEIVGKTPTNLLMFGVPNNLLDGATTEDSLMRMLAGGYARRCFFGYVKSVRRKVGRTPKSMFVDRTSSNNDASIQGLADQFEALADMVNANKPLVISEDTCIKLNEYQLHCETRADQLHSHQEMQKRELSERHFKVLKLAGAYAFVDDSIEVTMDHIENAIKLAEDSGDAFKQLLAREKNPTKLAKYIAAIGEDVSHSDLHEALPFYRGSASARQDMLSLAIAWGYRHNIIIKKSFESGIEFLRGESLKETDLNEMVVSYSTDFAKDYQNHRAPFDKLHQLTQANGMHWVAHHLNDGYRDAEHVIPGFNLIVIDVDGGCNMSTAKLLLKDHKYLMYTTKRHTDDEHRFRIILPANFELKLDGKDYKEFMKNVAAWLPFDSDQSASQRERKWMSHNAHYEYNDGQLFDVLPFIPKTAKSKERELLLNNQQSLDNLERWVINNIGDGNRNNMLLRYGMLLVDGGFDFENIRSRVVGLNEKIADKLEESEIMATIMITVAKAIAKRP